MNKLMKLREILESKNIDAILITDPYNRRYITNFTGTAGVAVIDKKDSYFITDFRYTEQAKEQAEQFTIIEHKHSIELELATLLKEKKISTLGFEENNLTYATYVKYKKALDINMIPVSDVVEKLRIIKTQNELSILKQAAKIADAAFEHIQAYIEPGVKEIEVANELEFFMRKKGATSSSFDIIVASGMRSARPHGVASQKEIESGELVTMDYGALYNGYCSDITRTVAVGNVNEELQNIYQTVLEAQKKGVNGIKPGMTGKDADLLPRDHIKSKGYGEFFGHATGHGLGLEVHEEPRLSPKSTQTLVPGMVVTVEPGIYVPNVGGCRIEDDIVITETGNERLTNASKDLVYL